MKRKITAAITAAALAASIGAYAASPADNLLDKGIIEGYEDGELHLERTLTRAEFTKMFSIAFLGDSEKIAEINFSDVAADYWGAEYIAKAVSEDIIDGFDDGTFKPEDTVTYEQALKMIVGFINGGRKEYPEGYVTYAVENGISDGITALIGEEISRGDVAALIDNTIKYIEDRKSDTEDNAVVFRSYGGGGGGSAAAANLAAAESMPVVGGSVYYDYEYAPAFNTEEYTANEENIFKNAAISPLSTFSIDTDTASYSNLRRYVLRYGTLPPNGAIRSEELINYFDYDNPLPSDGEPFSVSTETAQCPWNSDNELVKISVKGAELAEKQPSNLVFLLDVSGSMYSSDKLPLVKKSLKLLLNELDETDTVSIVTYASGTSVALESTPVSQKEKIVDAFDGLQAGGATYGEAGINLAYEQAEKNLIDGNNRIILCTDGDFNIGNSSTGELDKLISEKRDKGIFLTVLGFGMGNYKDNRMETLADKGNGNYAYIDSAREAKKVFVDEMPKTLYTIAKDVKIQVEFNPAQVKEYRLVGYENRVLNTEDFDNDKKDAGELGCGASVTAFYEIVPADGAEAQTLKYRTTETTGSDELMTVKLRYKEPNGDESRLVEIPVGSDISAEPSADFKFAAAAAELGMLLNDSEYKGSSSFESIIDLAREGIGEDRLGFRTEFLHIADLIRDISE